MLVPQSAESSSEVQETNKTVKCKSCSLSFDHHKELRDHTRDCHSTKVRVRVVNDAGQVVQRDLTPVNGQFICPVCDRAEIRTRSGILFHTNKHLSTDSRVIEGARHECSICAQNFMTGKELHHHYDEKHSEFQEVMEDPTEDDDTTRAKILANARTELSVSTSSLILTSYMFEALSPISIHHKSGQTSLALLTQTAAKRAASDPIVQWEPIKKPRVRTIGELGDLSSILASNRFGELIKIDDYMLLEAAFFVQSFTQFKDEIARKLAGAAEVYGRDPDEDPHAFSLAKPTLDVKLVTSIEHEKCRKLIVGTLFWSALVTSSLELTSGIISVGAHNKSAELSSRSSIWSRKDWELNPLAERQLRSKFCRKETFAKSASTFFKFSYWDCVPITIFSLNRHFSSKSSMSGVRASALLFHEIISSKSKTIKKKSLATILKDDKIGDAPKTQQIIIDLLRLIPPDQKKLKLIDNWEASNLLRQMADTLCGTIATKNMTCVVPNIQATVDKMLQELAGKTATE
ncbi:hypothetical protein BGX27_003739 [Mortierella sp. AM989]|nr:hypothetical protein BGX27_003739 [Mortierella sp. AM989]